MPASLTVACLDAAQTHDVDSQDSQDETEFTSLRRPHVTSRLAGGSTTESQNSEDDFDMPKVKVNRRTRLMLFDDESSLDSLPSTIGTPNKNASFLQIGIKPEVSDNKDQQDNTGNRDGSCVDLQAEKCVAVHQGVFDVPLNVADVQKTCVASNVSQVTACSCRLKFKILLQFLHVWYGSSQPDVHIYL